MWPIVDTRETGQCLLVTTLHYQREDTDIILINSLHYGV